MEYLNHLSNTGDKLNVVSKEMKTKFFSGMNDMVLNKNDELKYLILMREEVLKHKLKILYFHKWKNRALYNKDITDEEIMALFNYKKFKNSQNYMSGSNNDIYNSDFPNNLLVNSNKTNNDLIDFNEDNNNNGNINIDDAVENTNQNYSEKIKNENIIKNKNNKSCERENKNDLNKIKSNEIKGDNIVKSLYQLKNSKNNKKMYIKKNMGYDKTENK